MAAYLTVGNVPGTLHTRGMWQCIGPTQSAILHFKCMFNCAGDRRLALLNEATRLPPQSLRTDLRTVFRPFIDEDKFECFHFKRRPVRADEPVTTRAPRQTGVMAFRPDRSSVWCDWRRHTQQSSSVASTACAGLTPRHA